VAGGQLVREVGLHHRRHVLQVEELGVVSFELAAIHLHLLVCTGSEYAPKSACLLGLPELA